MQAMRNLFFADLHQAVRSELEGVLREPLPQRWLDLIKELERDAARHQVPVRSDELGKLRAKDERG
jgi:hypothetical protein